MRKILLARQRRHMRENFGNIVPTVHSPMTMRVLSSVALTSPQLFRKRTMPNLKATAEQFHALHVPGRPLVLFNAWDVGSAKAVAASGASAIATGSWAVAADNGYADGEHLPFELAL